MDPELLREFVATYPAQPATAYWRAIEIAALLRRKLPSGRGLDLGCGDGKLTKIILDRSGPRDLVGVDVDKKETDIARQFGLYRSVLTADATSLPVASSSFDFVLSNSVMEHIPDLNAVIAEASRVLCKGGTLVTTVPTIGFHANLRGSLLPWKARQDYLARLDARLAHIHYPSTRDWAEMLARNGLRLVHRFGYLDRSECRRWETLSRFTGGLLHAAGLGRLRPIEIQRVTGLRALQARNSLPKGISTIIANVIGGWRPHEPDYWRVDDGLDDINAGCLAVVATRQ
jgi:SAM-dependent methyltransferase